MSDELKPCPFCGGEVKISTYRNEGYQIECPNHEWPKREMWGEKRPESDIAADIGMFTWGISDEAKEALIEAWNTRADDAPKQPVDNAQADSRERLEADIKKYRWEHSETSGRVTEWLDRQAAITRAEVFADGEFDCMTCDAKRELQERVDSLEAERDELRDIIDHMPKTEQECEACQESHDRLMFNAKVDMENLRDELKHKQLVIDRQRDSFAKMERENAELRKMLADAAEAI